MTHNEYREGVIRRRVYSSKDALSGALGALLATLSQHENLSLALTRVCEVYAVDRDELFLLYDSI